MVEVFRGSRWEAEIVKGLLNTAGVESILKDESLSLVTSTYLNTGDQVAVLVNPEEEVYARKVVAEKSA